MTPAEPETTYVVPVASVRDAIGALLDRDTHPFFPAYLHLHRQSSLQGTESDIEPDWAELGEYLHVDGALPGKPYLRPFWEGQRQAGQEWLNSNLAGSFAPSSLRKAVYAVIDTTAEGKYVLRERHWELALEQLLGGAPAPALACAAFFMRDYGITGINEQPTGKHLILAFMREFGYGSRDEVEFDTVFDTLWGLENEPWLEPIARESAGSQP